MFEEDVFFFQLYMDIKTTFSAFRKEAFVYSNV